MSTAKYPTTNYQNKSLSKTRWPTIPEGDERTLLSLSTLGSWALIAYIIVSAFYIAHRTEPEEGDD